MNPPLSPAPAPGRRPRSAFSLSRFVLAWLVAAPVAMLPPPVHAQLPTGASVTAGSATITQAGNAMTINQASRHAIVNWQSFNLGADASLRLRQTGADAAMLARVVGSDPSQLLGSLQADGKLFLINPRGIVVGPGAVIDTAAFVASTHPLGDADFLRGTDLVFKGDSTAGIVNLGTIRAREGSVFLFAHTVKNAGVIDAPRGTAGLGAGTEVHLASPEAGEFTIKLNLPATTEKTGVENSGAISAVQARLEAAGGSIYELAVNQAGIVRATGSATVNGRVLLTAAGGTVGVSGGISARNADGSGGEILVGGDYRGGNAAVANAARTVVTSGAKLDASATTGAAGRVVVWADEAMRFLGTIDAHGAGGGFAEVSGKRFLDFHPAAPVQLGAGGTLLLDPDALVVSTAADNGTSTSGADPFVFSTTSEPATLNVTTLQNQLAATNVILDTSTSSGDITVASAVTWASDHTLRLQAGGSINLNASLTGGATSTLALLPGRNATPSAQGLPILNNRATLAAGATINVGTLTYGANAQSAPAGYTLDTPAGVAPLTLNGNVNVGTLEIDLSDGAAGVTTNGANNAIGAFRTTGTGTLRGAYVVDHQGGLDVTLNSTTAEGPYLQFITPGTLKLQSGSSLDFATPGSVILASTGGAFVNQAGAAVFGGNTRYLIYTSTPAATTRGGLAPAYVFNTSFDPATAPAPFDGDAVSRLIYSGAQATLTLAAANQSRAYGDANPVFTVTPGGLVDNDTLATAVTGTPALTTSATTLSNAGNYAIAITAGSLASSFYSLAFADGTLAVTPAPLDIAVDHRTRTYGDANPAFTATFTGLKNSDSAASVGTLALNTTATAASNAGTYAITGSLTGASANYAPTITPGTLTVNQAPLTVTVSNAITKNQGDPNPDFAGFTIASGLKLSDALATAVPDLAFDTPATTGSLAGNYAVTATGTSANYALTFNPGRLTIAAITLPILTYAADSLSRLYGDANPAFTFTRTGLLGGTPDDVTGAPAFSTVATQLSGVGAYQIDLAPGTLASGNYQFSFIPGTLTIAPAPLTVAVAGAARLYGNANPTFATSVTGLKNADAASAAGAFTPSTTATVTSSAGSYAVGGTLSGTSGNYTATVVPGTLTVDPAPLAVTIVDAARAPNTANPSFSATYSGFKNSDTFAVISGLAFATAATPSSPSGTYPITGSGTAANYDLTFVPGRLTIGGILNYSANDATRTYGAANPGFGYSVTGLLAGDTLASIVTGAPALSTAATQSSGVGAYAIAIAQGTLASPSYGFSFTPGTLTVERAPLTIVAHDAARTYGAANPVFAASYAGLVNGDSSSVVSGLQLSTTATAASHAGAYVIAASGAAAANYALDYQAGTLTVNPAPLTIAVDHASRVYGDANPAFSGNVLGLVNGDTTMGAGVTYETTAGPASPVNAFGYPITASLAANGDYVLAAFTPGALAVTPAPLVVRLDDQTRHYGDANPAFTFSVAGLKNSDLAAASVRVDGTGTTAAVTAGIGSYGILGVGTALSPNYTVTTQGGSLTVTPRPLMIAADDATRVYGDPNPAFTATFYGLVNGDTTAVAISLNFIPAGGLLSGVGHYAITPTGTTSANYTPVFAPGMLSITPATLTGTIDNAARFYGDANPAFSFSNVVGFKNSDSLATLTGVSPAISSPATPLSNVGSYAVTGSAVADNYVITLTPATLAVTPAPLTVGVAHANRTYGQANPAFSVAYIDGFRNGDTDSLLTGLSLSTAATAASNAGNYAIDGTATAANYAVTFVPGRLSVGRASATVTAGSGSRAFGDTLTLIPGFFGFLPADEPLARSTWISTPDSATFAAGLHFVGFAETQPGVGAVLSQNYLVTFVTGSLFVGPRPVDVTAPAAFSTVGTLPASFSATAPAPLAGGPAYTVVGRANASNASGVGAYTITPEIVPGADVTRAELDRYYAFNLIPGQLTLTLPPSEIDPSLFAPKTLTPLKTTTLSPDTEKKLTTDLSTKITLIAPVDVAYDTKPMTKADFANYFGSFSADMEHVRSSLAPDYAQFIAGYGKKGSLYETMSAEGRTVLSDWIHGRLSDASFQAMMASGAPGAGEAFSYMLPTLVNYTRAKDPAQMTSADRQILGRLADLTEERRADVARVAEQKYNEMIALNQKQVELMGMAGQLMLGEGDFKDIVDRATGDVLALKLGAGLAAGGTTAAAVLGSFAAVMAGAGSAGMLGGTGTLLTAATLGTLGSTSGVATGVSAGMGTGGLGIAVAGAITIVIRSIQMSESIKNEKAYNDLIAGYKINEQITSIAALKGPAMNNDVKLSTLMLATEFFKTP